MQIETFEKRAVEYIKKYSDYFTYVSFPYGDCKHLHFDYDMYFNIATDTKMYDITISQYLDGQGEFPLVQVTGNSWDECVEKALRVLKAYGPKPTRGRSAEDDEDAEESESSGCVASYGSESSTFTL